MTERLLVKIQLGLYCMKHGETNYWKIHLNNKKGFSTK